MELVQEEPQKKKQKGLLNTSIVLTPVLYNYNVYLGQTDMDQGLEGQKFAFGKIQSVPNASKGRHTYEVQYDRSKVSDIGILDEYTKEFPNLDYVKDLLKEAVCRADQMNYKFDGNKNRKPKKKSEKKSTTSTTKSPEQSLDSPNLSGILSELSPSINSQINSPSNSSQMNNPPALDDDSDSDEESNADFNESAFVDSKEVEDEEITQTETNEDQELNVLGEEWSWDHWEEITDEEEIPGPKETDHYNGPHGIKSHVASSFTTVLQCIFATTAMNIDFFKRLATQSNKYARTIMNTQSSSMFLGHKWRNISTGEMIRFFGIMLRISLEPRRMGGYTSYFQDNPTITLSTGYSVQLRGFDAWAKDVMPLIRFKQIRGAFHPETGTSQCGDKCHQLRYFIRRFNECAKKTFNLGPNVSFDEGGVAMRSRYCPVRQYNKDKPNKYRVDFFILADAKYYFIYHLDVYQGKNRNNIDVHEEAKKLPTTQKAVANAILKSEIANDPHGSRHLYMDNRYTAPQLLALMVTNWNLRGVGTCKANRKGFASSKLVIQKSAERGAHVRLVDKRLGMVITRWKDSKVLQTVSTVMEQGVSSVQRRTGASLIQVSCPNDIIKYQKYMGGVDRGDQHRVIGAGFSNVAHFKKWYKKCFLGIADFSMLQAFAAWNISINECSSGSRGGMRNRRPLVKWEFYAVAAEELMSYVDRDEQTPATLEQNVIASLHRPEEIPTRFNRKIPMCMICSMEESIARKVLGSANRHGRKFARRSKFLAKCADPNCNVIAHTCCPQGTKINSLPMFNGMNCFQIAHHPVSASLFTEINRQGKNYVRCIPTHRVALDIANVYKETLPRRSSRGRPSTVATPSPTVPTAPTAPATNSDFTTPESQTRKRTKRTPVQIQSPPLKQRLRNTRIISRRRSKRTRKK